MRLFTRKRSSQVAEVPCPRCKVSVPANSDVCNVCGWDMSDQYQARDHLPRSRRTARPREVGWRRPWQAARARAMLYRCPCSAVSWRSTRACSSPRRWHWRSPRRRSRRTCRSPKPIVLAGGIVVVIAVNLLLLRRVFGPLEQLTTMMRRIDPHAPGRRLKLDARGCEVADLSHAFNAMLDRLEDERRSSSRRALTAQENERMPARPRAARRGRPDAHRRRAAARGPQTRRAAPSCSHAIEELQEAARAGVEDVREIARGLRPAGARRVRAAQRARSRWPRRSPTAPACASGRGSRRSSRRSRPSSTSRSTASPRRASPTSRAMPGRNVTLELERATTARSTLRVRDDGRGITDREAAGPQHGPRRHARARPARRRDAQVAPRRAAARKSGSTSPARAVVSIPLRTRILIADDHQVVRRGLSMVLDTAPDLDVVAEAADGVEAVDARSSDDIDLADPRRQHAAPHRAAGRPRAGPPAPGAARADAVDA